MWVLIIRWAVPFLIGFSIWWPEYSRFSIDHATPSDVVVSRLIANPAIDKLTENASIEYSVTLDIPYSDRSDVAEKLLYGSLDLPNASPIPLRLQGWPNDLAVGGPTFQLGLASFSVENFLLKEFESTSEKKYYILARDRILSLARWESQQREPLYFLWNDHAVAARISTLIRLWKTLRNDPETTSAQRTELIKFVSRSGELLSKNNLFTVRTNHGVMQNLALLQISAAFPDLPKSQQWRALAIERLELQLKFYISDEGVVLEHSPGYHLFGNQLMGFAVQLARLNGINAPQSWLDKYKSSTYFSQKIIRPDGSIPLVGDTAGGQKYEPLLDMRQNLFESAHIYPLSGYGVWWSEIPVVSQIFIAWANHLPLGHKHADDPSVHFWSRNVDWITAVGYWPYGSNGGDLANGWAGSNAPHLFAEDEKIKRLPRLLGSGASDGIRVIDIENNRPYGVGVRRQIVQISAENFLVLDAVKSAKSPIETFWTLDPRLTLDAINDQQFISSADKDGYSLRIDIAKNGDQALSTALYRGSRIPFAGWVVVGSQPTPAASLRVEQNSGDSFTATLFTVDKEHTSGFLKIIKNTSFDNWSIQLPDSRVVQRNGNLVKVDGASDAVEVNLVAPESTTNREHLLKKSIQQAIDAYPLWRDLHVYQVKVYMVTFGLWLLIEVVMFFLWWCKRIKKWMNPLIFSGWFAFFIFINFYYLV
jgi:hypothetical protein